MYGTFAVPGGITSHAGLIHGLRGMRVCCAEMHVCCRGSRSHAPASSCAWCIPPSLQMPA